MPRSEGRKFLKGEAFGQNISDISQHCCPNASLLPI